MDPNQDWSSWCGNGDQWSDAQQHYFEASEYYYLSQSGPGQWRTQVDYTFETGSAQSAMQYQAQENSRYYTPLCQFANQEQAPAFNGLPPAFNGLRIQQATLSPPASIGQPTLSPPISNAPLQQIQTHQQSTSILPALNELEIQQLSPPASVGQSTISPPISNAELQKIDLVVDQVPIQIQILVPSADTTNEHKCLYCEKTFKSNYGCTQHINAKHKDLDHTCEKCGKKFDSEERLTTHLYQHTNPDKPFKCQEPGCERSYVHKNDFRRHQLKHNPLGMPFQCYMCGKPFCREDQLRGHENAHIRRQQKLEERTAKRRAPEDE